MTFKGFDTLFKTTLWNHVLKSDPFTYQKLNKASYIPGVPQVGTSRRSENRGLISNYSQSVHTNFICTFILISIHAPNHTTQVPLTNTTMDSSCTPVDRTSLTINLSVDCQFCKYFKTKICNYCFLNNFSEFSEIIKRKGCDKQQSFIFWIATIFLEIVIKAQCKLKYQWKKDILWGCLSDKNRIYETWFKRLVIKGSKVAIREMLK